MTSAVRRSCISFILASLAICVGSAHGQVLDAPDTPTIAAADATVASDPQTGTAWALIICGHPGDDDHHVLFSETIEALHDALIAKLGFEATNIHIQFGAEPNDEDGPAVTGAKGQATQSELKREVEGLRKALKPTDTFWVFVLGHAHYDGRKSYLNLPGASQEENDMHEDDFARLFDGLPATRQVFFMTTPVSGFFIRPLSAKGRIVVTATEPDREVNETLYPLALAETLAEPPEMKVFDVDGDGKTSLFDLYINVAQNVARRYATAMLLSTEHGNLDDNGDGRGTELQLDYLTEEEGGRAAAEGADPPKIRPNSEGYIAQQFVLPIALPEPEPEPEPKPETPETPSDSAAKT